MTYAFIAEHCSDLPVTVCCRVMGVSTSGYYQRRCRPVTDRELAEAYAANTVFDIWTMSRRSYGSPRVRHELRLGMGRRCSKTQAERWMRHCGAVGIHYPARRGRNGCTRRDGTDPNPDLVNRRFDPEGPDRLWVMDVTEHRTGEGKMYLAAVVDAWSRRVVGWSIADHIRAVTCAPPARGTFDPTRHPRSAVLRTRCSKRREVTQERPVRWWGLGAAGGSTT